MCTEIRSSSCEAVANWPYTGNLLGFGKQEKWSTLFGKEDRILPSLSSSWISTDTGSSAIFNAAKILGISRRSAVKVVKQKLKMISYRTRKAAILTWRKRKCDWRSWRSYLPHRAPESISWRRSRYSIRRCLNCWSESKSREEIFPLKLRSEPMYRFFLSRSQNHHRILSGKHVKVGAVPADKVKIVQDLISSNEWPVSFSDSNLLDYVICGHLQS